MTTKKILNEKDVKKIVREYFITKQGLKVASIQINLTSRSLDRGETSTYHVFDNITVTLEEEE